MGETLTYLITQHIIENGRSNQKIFWFLYWWWLGIKYVGTQLL